MESLDQWWADSPFERRPELPVRTEEHVPQHLQFQRAAHDANLGEQTSHLMRLSPVYFERFGADASVAGHLADMMVGMWEYLEPDPNYRPRRELSDVWAALGAI